MSQFFESEVDACLKNPNTGNAVELGCLNDLYHFFNLTMFGVIIASLVFYCIAVIIFLFNTIAFLL